MATEEVKKLSVHPLTQRLGGDAKWEESVSCLQLGKTSQKQLYLL